MFESSVLQKVIKEESEARKAENSASFDYIFGKGRERLNAGVLSILLTFALASHFYRPPTITEDRFVEAGESFTAPARSIISGNMDKDVLFGLGYPLYDNNPTSGEIYLAIDKPVTLRARSKGYVRKVREREDPRSVVDKTMEWQAKTPTFCRTGCESINIRHNGKMLDMLPEEPYGELKKRYP